MIGEPHDRTGSVGVAIVDDDRDYAATLADLLGLEPDLAVVGVRHSVVDGAALLADHRIDVALIDVNMPSGGGARLVELARRRPRPPRLVLISATDLPAELHELKVPFVQKQHLDDRWVRSLARGAPT